MSPEKSDAPGAPPSIWSRPERSGRGPAPSLTREEIAAAAVDLADAEGIEAVSMRALAARLGVGATSLYRYVERKEELVELMVDAVFGEELDPEPSEEWQASMRAFARSLRELHLRHPWMTTVGSGRPRLGPNSAARFERALSALDGSGLDIDQMLVVVETIDAFVRGRAASELAERTEARSSGLGYRQWMETQAPFVIGLLESGEYPMIARVVADAQAPHDPDRIERIFDQGLERILDGLATMIDRPSRG